MERLAAAALGAAIVLGSAFIWIGIPLGGFWLAGELTSSDVGFLFAVLGGVPLAMVAFGFLLYRLNDLYQRRRGGEHEATIRRAAWLHSSSDEQAGSRRTRGGRALIDISMTASAVAALVLFLVWFLFLARMNPI